MRITAAWACSLPILIACSGTNSPTEGGAAGAEGAAGRTSTRSAAGASGGRASLNTGATGGGATPTAAGGAAGSPTRAVGSVGGQGAAGSAAGSSGTDEPQALPSFPAPVAPGDPGSADVTLAVRTDKPLHAISALIYGTNGIPEGARVNPTVVRSGGNRLTAYNWENNASNAGKDYLYQNDDLLSSSNEPAKPILDGIRAADALGAASIVTIPIVDYVSADKNGGGDVRNSGADYLKTRFKQNKPTKGGAASAMPDAADAFVYEDEFATYLKTKAPTSRVLFSLDNEPDLWSDTHPEVHPMAVTYAELWDRNQQFASALKQVWPEARVLGFVS